MEDVLSFVDGSETEPVLGLELDASISFAELLGDLPTASTCVNELTFAPTDKGEDYLCERLHMSFRCTYFGMQ